MNIKEYEKIKNLTYVEYCDYLQPKYGIGLSDYMTKSWNKNNKVTRTKDGLLAHHKYEDRAIMLSNKEYAKNNPFEWQKAENIIYCDYLEHLFLHILICECPSCDKNLFEDVGIGGVVTFKNSKKLKRVVENLPIGNIVLETDGPYLSPDPFRGKRNDSSRLKYVVEKIAELKNMDPEEVARITFANAVKMYGLEGSQYLR